MRARRWRRHRRAFARTGGAALRTELPPLAILLAASLLGAKLYSVAERGHFYPLVLELQRGFRYPGGVVGLAAAFGFARLFWPNRSLRSLGDHVAPAFAFAMATVRIGCWLNGCCGGRPSTLPWAMPFPIHSEVWAQQVRAGIVLPDAPMSLAVHPFQLYCVIQSLAIGALLVHLQRRGSHEGRTLIVFLASYGASGFFLNLLRQQAVPYSGVVSVGMVVAAGMLVLMRPRAVRADRFAGAQWAIDERPLDRTIARVSGGRRIPA